jgi:superkiller protein 3
MRRAWLTTIGAALYVATTAIEPAAASPAGMSLRARPVATKTSTGSWTDKLKFWDKDPPAAAPTQQAYQPPVSKPTDVISPWRHPITYFSVAMAQSPLAAALHRDKAEPALPEPADKLSLSTPTGPATPQFYVAVAQMSERQGNAQQARQQLQQGLHQWPRDVELLRAAARLEDRQGNLPLAETLYHRAVAANPQQAGALNDLGLCLARQGKFEQSVQAIEQAINLQPDKPLYRNNAATVLVEMRQDQRALAHLSAAHGPAESSYNLGQLLADRGRPHEAVMYFQQALELDPTMQPAQLAIAQLSGAPATARQFAAEPAMQQQGVIPSYSPKLAPQQSVAEPTFPATARGPELGTSSYVPPKSYYPSTATPTAPVYQTATAPRYLPPVRPIVPDSMVR